MIIKANEINKYMQLHNVDKVPVEVLITDIPECKQLHQGARKLAKRLVITSAYEVSEPWRGRNNMSSVSAAAIPESVRIDYVMYSSFKKSRCSIPAEWEFEVLIGDVGQRILAEFADHGGNLEQKFRSVFAKHNPDIQEKINQAAKLIKEAEDIAEQHGIPFAPEANLMQGMPTGYVPVSFDAIFGDLREDDDANEVINELTGVYCGEYAGWQNSSSNC